MKDYKWTVATYIGGIVSVIITVYGFGSKIYGTILNLHSFLEPEMVPAIAFTGSQIYVIAAFFGASIRSIYGNTISLWQLGLFR